MLPGAITGIKYYLQPELSRLKEVQVFFKYLFSINELTGAPTRLKMYLGSLIFVQE